MSELPRGFQCEAGVIVPWGVFRNHSGLAYLTQSAPGVPWPLVSTSGAPLCEALGTGIQQR